MKKLLKIIKFAFVFVFVSVVSLGYRIIDKPINEDTDDSSSDDMFDGLFNIADADSGGGGGDSDGGGGGSACGEAGGSNCAC